MKQVHQYITEELVECIDQLLCDTDVENNRFVPKVYKGYISSMGASLIQSGILPTMAFYNDKGRETNKGSEKPKYHLLNVLRKMLVKKDPRLAKISLPELVISMKDDPDELRQLQRELINASVALKLTLRIFKLK